jgi:phytoene desaturase
VKRVKAPSDHVVIVGAGLAGLSAAMRLAGAGRRVTVLERGAGPGGRAAQRTVSASSGEYRFDPGPTVLTMPELIADCFDALGEQMSDWLNLRPVAPIYRTNFADGSRIDVHADEDAMADEIERVCGPQDAAGFRDYVRFVSRLYKYEIKDFIDSNTDSPFGLLTPNLARIVAIGGLRKLAPAVGRYLKDDRLQRIYSFQALYAGLSPYQALAIYAVISYMDSVAGVYFPAGGMNAVPASMAAAAEKHGVEFRYHTTVTRVVQRGGRAEAVVTEDGQRIPCDAVILTPDLPVAYEQLLGRKPLQVRRLKYSPSCYLLLAGSRAEYETTTHHNIHFGSAWREIFEELEQGRLMSDPSFLVTQPTLSDPRLAPPNRHIYYVLFPTPNLRSGIDWERIGPAYREHVLATLDARGYPGFESAIDVEDITTPATWAADGMAAGTPFGAAHTFFQTGPFRPGNLTGENIVFAGSGTRPGVGVPMVLISGRLAAERITGPTPAYRSRAYR